MLSKLILGFMCIMISSLLYLGEGAGQKSKNPELNCYMPYSVKRDHMVVGCEIPGYHMRYDLAKQSNIFMVLLPNGFDSLESSPVYFSIDTLSLDGGSLKELFDHDIEGIVADKPGTKIVKNLQHKLNIKTEGDCLGAQLAYPKELAAFPFETFFVCNTGSKKYAIMVSMGARTEKDLMSHQAAFMKWVDIPQMVKDAKIFDGK